MIFFFFSTSQCKPYTVVFYHFCALLCSPEKELVIDFSLTQVLAVVRKWSKGWESQQNLNMVT